MRCAGNTSQIHGGPSLQLTGTKGSTTNRLVPATTGLVESMPRYVIVGGKMLWLIDVRIYKLDINFTYAS